MMRGRRGRPTQAGFQRLVGERLDLSPAATGRAGAPHRGPDGTATDPEALRDYRWVCSGTLLPAGLPACGAWTVAR